jgi:hypothetical protein
MYLIKSPVKTKKFRAVFSDGTHTDFGASAYTDYTISHDKEQRTRYITRHRNHSENWNNPRSAGALARYILWGDRTSVEANLRDYKVRFAGKV